MIADYMIEKTVEALQELTKAAKWMVGLTGGVALICLVLFIYETLRDR